MVGAGLASLVVLGGFVVWESRSTHPMLKLEFFRDRRFSVALAAECLAVFGLMGALFLSTQFLQFDLGYSPLQAGLRILPIAVMVVVGAAVSPLAARLVGVKLTVAAGLVSIAAGLWQVSASSRFDTTYGDVVLGLLLIGFGAGLMLPTATNSVIGSVPQGDSGMGSASNTVALQVGGALGVAVIGSVMLTRYQGHMAAALAGRHVPCIGRTDHLRVPGRCPGGGGTRRRLDRGRAGPRRAHRLHERQRGGARRGRHRRPGRRGPRARGAALRCSLQVEVRRRAGRRARHRFPAMKLWIRLLHDTGKEIDSFIRDGLVRWTSRRGGRQMPLSSLG